MESASYNAGPGILGLTWAATGVATLIMLLRLIAKYRIRNLSWDDATMVLAYVCNRLQRSYNSAYNGRLWLLHLPSLSP